MSTDGCYKDYTMRLFYMTSVSMVFEVTEQMNPARLPAVFSPFPFFQADLYKASQPGKCTTFLDLLLDSDFH